MRILLVLGAVAALALVAWLALALGPGREPANSEPIAPISVTEEPRAPLAHVDLGRTERTESAPRDPRVGVVERVAAAKFTAVTLVFALLDEKGAPLPGPTHLECADPLARVVPAAPEATSGARWVCANLVPGPHTVTASANGRIPRVVVVDVTGETAEQLVELRLAVSPIVRVRWQTETGAPFLDAVRAPGILVGIVMARIAADTQLREVGDTAPLSQRTCAHEIAAGFSRAEKPGPLWPGAPPDAVCWLEYPAELPGFVHGSIDGVVLASARIDAEASEIVLRTPLALVQRMRATVRFCLVDGSTGERIGDAQFWGNTRAGVPRSLVDVGPEGCRTDPRFTPGSWLFSFGAPGRATVSRAADLRAGEEVDLGEIRFTEQGELVVHARRSDGRPAAGVRLAVLGYERFAWGESTLLSTDPRGTARFVGLPDEQLVLVVADPRATAKAQKVEPQSTRGTAPIDLVVEDGVEVVLDFGPQAILVQRAYIHDADGLPIAAVTLPPSGLVPLRLLPGSYVIELEDAQDSRAIEVGRESAVYEVR